MTLEEQEVFDRHIEAATQATVAALEALMVDPDKDEYDLVRIGRLDVAAQLLGYEHPEMREEIKRQFTGQDEEEETEEEQ